MFEELRLVPMIVARSVADALRRARPGKPIPIDGGHLVPIVCREGSSLASPPCFLAQAVADGTAEVAELDPSADIASVEVHNRNDHPLIVLGGERIVGARQDRIFNATFVVAPHARARLPVSCVELGRWETGAERFTVAGATVHATARCRLVRRVRRSLSRGLGFRANQIAVWREVAMFLRHRRVQSPTQSYEDGAASSRPFISRMLHDLCPSPRQVGIAFVRHGQIRTLDLFPSAAHYLRAHDVLLRGLLLERRPSRRRYPRAPELVVAHALRLLRLAVFTPSPSPALGVMGAGESGSLTFHVAFHEETFAHLVAVTRAAKSRH